MLKFLWNKDQVANLLIMLIQTGHDPAEFFTRRKHMKCTTEILFPHRVRYSHRHPIVQSFLPYPECCDYMIDAVYMALDRDMKCLWRVLNAQSRVRFEYRPPQ